MLTSHFTPFPRSQPHINKAEHDLNMCESHSMSFPFTPNYVIHVSLLFTDENDEFRPSADCLNSMSVHELNSTAKSNPAATAVIQRHSLQRHKLHRNNSFRLRTFQLTQTLKLQPASADCFHSSPIHTLHARQKRKAAPTAEGFIIPRNSWPRKNCIETNDADFKHFN